MLWHEKSTFEMTNLGTMDYSLALEVWQNEGNIFISPTKYAKELLQKFKITDYEPSNTPLETRLKLIMEEDLRKVEKPLY